MPEPHFGNHCLHRQLWDIQGENINRMSSLLCGMFPLRIHACHQRKWNVSRWACSLHNSLIWTFSHHFKCHGSIFRMRGGGEVELVVVWGLVQDHLKKKAALQPGERRPPPPSLLPPPSSSSSLFLTVWFDWCRGCATSGSMRKGSSIQSQFIPFKWKNQ